MDIDKANTIVTGLKPTDTSAEKFEQALKFDRMAAGQTNESTKALAVKRSDTFLAEAAALETVGR